MDPEASLTERRWCGPAITPMQNIEILPYTVYVQFLDEVKVCPGSLQDAAFFRICPCIGNDNGL